MISAVGRVRSGLAGGNIDQVVGRGSYQEFLNAAVVFDVN